MVEMFCWSALVIVPYPKVVRALGSVDWLCVLHLPVLWIIAVVPVCHHYEPSLLRGYLYLRRLAGDRYS